MDMVDAQARRDEVSGGALRPRPEVATAAGQMRDMLLDSRDLFVRSRVVRIRHGDEEYRLQLTRNGKLILVK